MSQQSLMEEGNVHVVWKIRGLGETRVTCMTSTRTGEERPLTEADVARVLAQFQAYGPRGKDVEVAPHLERGADPQALRREAREK